MTRYPAESLTRDEVLAILDACSDTFAGQRNRALIAVIWRAGLRLGEALALRPQDIDWDSMSIRVLHGKGDKARTVGIDQQALEAVSDWLTWRLAEVTRPGAPLFCTRKGGPVAQSYVRRTLPRLARDAGVEKRVHAHVFRHTFAVELTRANVPMPLIQRLLGHASLGTTSIYLASLSPEEALDAVRRRKW
jgi:integrase/recombinase XerD